MHDAETVIGSKDGHTWSNPRVQSFSVPLHIHAKPSLLQSEGHSYVILGANQLFQGRSALGFLQNGFSAIQWS